MALYGYRHLEPVTRAGSLAVAVSALVAVAAPRRLGAASFAASSCGALAGVVAGLHPGVACCSVRRASLARVGAAALVLAPAVLLRARGARW